MLKLDVLTATVVTLVLAELGDKTQLLAVAMAARGRPVVVFAASSLGFVAANIIVVPLGLLLYSVLGQRLLGCAIGVLFVTVGVLTLFGRGERTLDGSSFAKNFLLMLLAELGDKTNAATFALAASTAALAEVAVGVVVAAVLLMALATTLGAAMVHRLPSNLVRKAVSAAFIAAGLSLLCATLFSG